MRDMLPQEMERFRKVEDAFRGVCLGWGYEEIRTPTIEHLHLFTSAGTLSPQMLGRVYSFLDWDGWSGERVVLRPESTIPAARLYVERLRGSGVAKLFYVQNVFRFAQGEESREDWQCGVELIGDTQPEGDIELILMGCEALEGLGLTPEVRLSHPGILRAVLARAGFDATEQLALFDRILDADLSALEEVKGRLPDVRLALDLLLAGDGEGAAYLEDVRDVFQGVIPELKVPLDELAAVAAVLTAVGRQPRVAPVLVRNFEYYTGPVFHLQAGGEKVGGGGRYDSLLSLVGGEAVPASGFAVDASRLVEMLAGGEAARPAGVRVRAAADDPPALAAAFRAAAALRARGWRVQVGGAAAEDGEWELVAGADGFVLSERGAKARRLESVEAVVAALGESGKR